MDLNRITHAAGIGGGVPVKRPARSDTLPAGSHPVMPSVHTNVSLVNRPETAWDFKVDKSKGPFCWPSTAKVTPAGASTPLLHLEKSKGKMT